MPGPALSEAARVLLRCPRCHHQLRPARDGYACADPGCGARYPVVERVPVIINEDNSVFNIRDFEGHRSGYFIEERPGLMRTLARRLPSISMNVRGKRNYARLADLLSVRAARSMVLVLGGSILGEGMEVLSEDSSVDLVESDIAFGPRTSLICDAHDIPFPDGTFDAVIAQAVLEHVVDPYRCVAEMHRVLKHDGLVYAETPFMQQVHGGRYDFTRFTHLGHRRLFRHFDEIESGIVCGPGMGLAWSYQYFLQSFATSGRSRAILGALAAQTAFFLKYFDSHLADSAAALDAASGLYFLGRRSEHILPDRELLKLYRGALR